MIRFLSCVALVLLANACRAGTSAPSLRPGSAARADSAAEKAKATSRALALMPTPENGLVDRRIQTLQALVKKMPKRGQTLVELGRAWVWKARESSDPGYYLNADACAELALETTPDDPLALDLRALVLLNDHRFREAKALSQSILDRDPDAVMALGSLSDALLELGELERAERAAQQMLDLKPNLPSYSRVAYFQWLRGEPRAALESARLAIDAGNDAKNPEPRAWVIVQAAMMFWHQGDYDGADAGFSKALESLAEYPPALVGRGRVALAKHDFKTASRFLERAYAKSPLVETAWLLGQARELASDSAGARAAFADAERSGARVDKRTLSLMLSTRDEQPARALELAEAERASRADIYSEDALAWALYRNMRYAEARAAIERARRFGTREARLLFHEGAIRIALGERTAGLRLLAQALAQNPAFDLREARELVELQRANGVDRRLAVK